MIYQILSILLAVIVFIFSIILWMWYKNPQYLISNLNNRIDDNQETIISAWDSENKNIVEFNQLITINHDDILAEVIETMKEYKDVPMNEISSINEEWLKNEDKWHPIWVRFMGE